MFLPEGPFEETIFELLTASTRNLKPLVSSALCHGVLRSPRSSRAAR